MRVVFFGTPELATPTLAKIAADHVVVAVVCQPDRPQGRSGKPVACPVKTWALEHGVPVSQPVALNDGAFESWLKEQKPDICVLVAYGRILKQPILDVPLHGFLNMHPSLLPRHRGPSPIQTAILEDDSVTGVCVMRLDAGMDTGDILSREEVSISEEDTTETLSERLAKIGAEAVSRALTLIERGEAVFTPQDNAIATTCRMFRKEDGRIRWNKDARAISCLIRASTPWPVAHCLFHGAVTRILKARPLDETQSAAPGSVIRVERNHIVIATGQGAIAVEELQIPGKRAMLTDEFLRGHPVAPGDKFEEIS